MYLKNIAIKNIGAIEELSIEMPFNENNIPKPVIFVGENGTGKTILQSQIMDAFYEIASSLFDDIGIQDGNSRKYYKISGGLNLRVEKEQGFCLLQFNDHQNQKIEYFDKIGKVKQQEFISFIKDFELLADDKQRNQKQITNIGEDRKESLRQEWRSGVHFYQPANRYEEPFWKNEPFINKPIFGDRSTFSRDLGKDIEVVSSMKENKAFLMDLVLDFQIYRKNIDEFTREIVNHILRKIKNKDNIRFGIGPRGGYRVSIVKEIEKEPYAFIPSIDNLSLGESILLNLFLNIIRHGDNLSKPINEISGIVVIDEIDTHLHIDLQKRALPELIQMFPKIQFILTTHSPLFLLGMENVFGKENFEIRNMPRGNLITTERFSEFENAYNVIAETQKFEKDIINKIQESQKPILFFEGDIDITYFKKALEFFSLNIDVHFENGDGESELYKKHKYAKGLNNTNNLNLPKCIFIFDCDTNQREEKQENILKFKISEVADNPIKKGIENLFSKQTLEKAIKEKKAFIDITEATTKIERGVKKDLPEEWVVNEDEKTNLCHWICENGTEEEFENFKPIIEKINLFLNKNSSI